MFFLAATALLSGFFAWGQDFDQAYRATEFASKFGADVYNGSVRPVWTDEDSFVFQTNEPGGNAWYKVTGTAKTAISEDEFKEASKRPRPDYYDPSDESQYAFKREVKRFSPDSTLVAFVRDNNVWLSKADGSDPGQLSFDGTDTEAYSEIQWSPDGKKIAALKKEVLKERQILLRVSRPDDQVQPRYRWLDYAKPGDRLPQCTPALFDVEARKAVPLDRSIPRDQYFLTLGPWAPDSDFFTYEYNQRGHQVYELAAVDAATGKVRTLAKEETDTFVYYYDLWRYLFSDGKHMLWISERDD